MMHLQCTPELNPQILRNQERHINNNFKYWVRDMTQHLRVLIVQAEDLGLISITHVVTQNHQ